MSGRFYGVYLLCSDSTEKRHRGKCYVGYTVNPRRRIRQHNRGREFGGAKKTSNRGPWTMVLIVQFPNNIAALQFEWAWQQPAMSTRLKLYTDILRKKKNETHFQYHFRILSRMLLVGPWNRLPLTLHWLEESYERPFESTNLPPSHMQIIPSKYSILLESSTNGSKSKRLPINMACRMPTECHLCMKAIVETASSLNCLNSKCRLCCHVICLATYFNSVNENQHGHYVPLGGTCPLCQRSLLWGDLLKQKKTVNMSIGGDEHYSEDETDDDEEQQNFDENSDSGGDEDSSDDDDIVGDNGNQSIYILSD